MQPETLTRLLNSMETAADLVEAFDDPELRSRRGWCLEGWSYDLVPWGVRFVQHGRSNGVTAAVVALALPEASRAAPALAGTASTCRTTVLFLG